LIEKLTQIETYHMQQFAYFVEKMKNTQDGSGSLLHHSAIVYGAPISDPNRHDHDHCPTLLVGNAGGLDQDWHLRSPRQGIRVTK
jgi:hypothetical protein